jgi:hypothetical protein
MGAMQQLSGFIDDTERLLIEKLDGFACKPGATCNLGDWLHYFAFDVSIRGLRAIALLPTAEY